MSQYLRRPFAMGNTQTPVLSQPEMRGCVRKDTSGAFDDLPLPSELVLETEDADTSGGLSIVFTSSRLASDVVAAINTTMAGYAEAEEVEGCLVVRSAGVGDGAYIRVHPPISGFDDASSYFGFEAYPHPLATVRAGDMEDAPARPRQQVNPVGTKYVAAGEDRIGSAYNRALQVLGINADTMYTWLRRPVARLARLTIDHTEHAAYVDENADGTVDQVDLSDLSVFDAALDGKRLYVGGLSKNSSLAAISRLYAVLDPAGKQIPAGDEVVRIGAVTRGSRSGLTPTFATEDAPPTGPLSDTTGTSADGGSALGVNRLKHAATTIHEVRERTTVVCEDATFETAGVAAGDVVVVAGASVTSPFSHDGTYLVEVVVSETTLVLRPHEDSDQVRELNPATGDYGTVAVYSGGAWETGLWVSFYPPLPRFPPGGTVTLVVPVEEELGQVSVSDVVEGDVRSSADVAGWTLLNLWRNLTMGGVYQGMAGQLGSGFFGNVTHRPVRFDLSRSAALSDGSSGRSSTGAATLDAHTLRLTAAADDRFDVQDVGKTILLTAGPFLADEPWTIVRLVDNATVELAPPLHRAGYGEVDGTTVSVTAWEIVEDDAIDVYGAVNVVAPDTFGEDDDSTAAGGYLYTREQRDVSSTDAPLPGLFSFLHLEHVRLTRAGANITVTIAGPTTASNVLPLSFDPEDSSNIFGESYDTKTGAGQSSITFARILNGPDAGLYRVKALHSSTVSTNSVELQHLDGSEVTLTNATSPAVSFYNAAVATSVPIYGGPGALGTWMAALSLFMDAHEQDIQFATPLRVAWRGPGAGLLAYLNDPEFKSYDNGDGADGPLISAGLYAPAEGIDVEMTAADSGASARRAGFVLRARARTNRFDSALSTPGGSGVLFHSQRGYTAYVSQTGKDPALVVVKQDRASGSESTQYSKLTAAAAAVVGRAGDNSASPLAGPSGIGSALELAGSLYVYRRTEDSGTNPAWSEGGIYSESVVGAGRWLRPSLGLYDFSDSPSYGTDSYVGWESPTQLGTAGRTHPEIDDAGFPSGDLLPPDYAIFNYRHTGLLYVSDVAGIFEAPFNRLVGQRVKIDDAGSAYDGDEFVVLGTVQTAADNLYLALYSPTTTVASDDVGRSFVVLGQRWHEAHLNVAEWMLFGSALERGSLENAPLYALLEDPVNSALGRTFTAVSDPDLQTLQSLSPHAWGATDGVRIGLGGALAALPSVDVTSAAYDTATTWDSNYTFIQHGWAVDSFEPRGTFPNVGVLAMSDADGAETPVLNNSYKGSLVVNDVAISFPAATGGRLRWSEKWGGCLHLNRATVGATMTMRVWRPGHSAVFTSHLTVRLTVILQVQDSNTVVLALRKADGTAVASSSTGVLASTTPQEVSVDLVVLDEDVLHASGLGGVAASRSPVAIFPTMDLNVRHTTDDVYLLEFKAELLTKPVLQDGPLIVAGPVLAHGFRHPEPVRGYDTRGPLDADMLTSNGFGLANASLNEVLTKYPDADLDRIGSQELDGMPGRIRTGTGWQQLVAHKELFFSKGPNAATITLVNGAYDPVYFIYKTCDPTGGDTSIHAENFQLPGRTGFVVPFDPPHGALLTSLALSMSFRPNYYQGDDELHWGVFRALYYDDPPVAAPATTPSAAQILEKTAHDEAAGVYVELWRHNALDMGVDEDQNAEFSEDLPPYGFSERILRLSIDLSGDTPPSWDTNEVDSDALPGFTGLTIYAGTEHFVRRSWDLLQEVAAADYQVLRVDRRQYTYFMTIRFWGGPRDVSDIDGTEVYSYSRAPSFGNSPALNEDAVLGGTLSDSTVALSIGYPGETGGAGGADDVCFPPQAKFRGARLGWITDRAGNGGWGS